MDVICMAGQHWAECDSGMQEILPRLARRGHRILYVEPSGGDGLRDVGPGSFYVHTLQAGEAIRKLGFADSVVVSDSFPPDFAQETIRRWKWQDGNSSPAYWEHAADRFEEHLQEVRKNSRDRAAVPHSRARAIEGKRVDDVWPDPPARLEEYGRDVEEKLTPQFLAMFRLTQTVGGLLYALRYVARLAVGKRHPEVRNILVGRKAAVGDLLMTAPMLATLRRRYPEAKIVLAVQKGMTAGALLECSPDVDEIRELDFLNSSSRMDQLRGAVGLLLEGFDVAFSGFRYFLLREAFLSGAPKTYGVYNGSELQKKNKLVMPADLSAHEAEVNVGLVELLTRQPEDRSRPPQVALDEDKVRDRTAELLPRLGLEATAKILLVHAGSKNPTRRWPAERFAELSTRLLRDVPELMVVYTGSHGERALVASVREAVPRDLRNRTIDTTGLTDFYSLWGLLKISAATISNDTGVMHLARAAGAPLLAVLGPENDRRWSPHPEGSAPAVALRNVVPCAPCPRLECNAHYCLRTMGVERVYREACSLLKRGNPSSNKLQRKMEYLDWGMLHDAGYTLPRAAAVALGGNGMRREAAQWLAEQTYPELDRTVREGDAIRDADALLAFLGAAGPELISVLTPEVRWEPERLSSHVAALMRVPEAEYAYTASRKGAPRQESKPALGLCTFRRTSLARVLLDRRPDRSPSGLGEIANEILSGRSGTPADVPQPRSEP